MHPEILARRLERINQRLLTAPAHQKEGLLKRKASLMSELQTKPVEELVFEEQIPPLVEKLEEPVEDIPVPVPSSDELLKEDEVLEAEPAENWVKIDEAVLEEKPNFEKTSSKKKKSKK